MNTLNSDRKVLSDDRITIILVEHNEFFRGMIATKIIYLMRLS